MNMIETVARAIHEKRRNPDANKHWFHEDADKCELSMQLAKAAIEAMRDDLKAHLKYDEEGVIDRIDAALEEK